MNKNILSLGAVAMDVMLGSTALPEEDGFALLTGEQLVPGGSASNVSVALQSLGIKTYQAGKIGDDGYGTVFRKTLTEAGVDDRYLITKKGGVTLHTYIVLAPEGKHCIFANLGDCVTNLEKEELPEDILESMDGFYTDMFSPRASLWLGRQALKGNVPVVYNMQCPPDFMAKCGVSRAQIDEMIGLSTLFVSGRDGYFEMTGKTDFREGMKVIYEKYRVPGGVLCSAGDLGAFWYVDETMLEVPAFSVEAVDTTGAGDCFLAGLLYAYLCEGSPREQALRFACGVAAIKCTKAGPRSRATAREIQDFIGSAV